MDFYAAVTVAIVFGSLLMGLFIICATIAKLAGSGGNRASNDEEAKLMQEIHQGLSKMEQRIEALEIVLFDREQGGGR